MSTEIRTKAPHPISTLNHQIIHPLIKTYFEFIHLKQIYRRGWLTHGIPPERCESVAEHSFGMAVMAMILADTLFPELETLKVLRMVLIHDFGEIYAGDTIPGDQISAGQKHFAERESLVQIFSTLANGEEYISLWEEFENGTSPEARFVRQIDKLEMALQASVYEHQELANLAEFFKSASSGLSSPEIQSILGELENMR
jgi:putative hydrolase of HD superfamily